MHTPHRLDMDMNVAAHWPGRVRLRIRIDHGQGQPEDWRLALDPGTGVGAVAVFADPGLAARGEGRHVLWHNLPGRTLRMRSLSVLAVAMFDSVKMVPRICGLPLWHSVSLILSAAGHEAHATRMELKLNPAGTPRAVLRHRRGSEDPWNERAIVLDNWDADPLRAMLRQGMALPDPGPRPMGPTARDPWFREGAGLAGRPGDAASRPQAPG
jgi:hypothetical protein